MPAKFVFVTELKTDQTRAGKTYTYLYDQDKTRWNLFNGEQVELRKGYVFDFEVNGEYSNVKAIKPVINIFQQKALAEVANRNDYKRDLFMAVSYAKDMVCANQTPATEIFALAESIYKWVNETTDKLMPKDETK